MRSFAYLKSSLFLIFFIGFTSFTFCQNRFWGVAISNNVTSFPITGYPKLFYSQFHPGIDFTYGLKLNKSERSAWYFTASAGGYYHRFVQTLIRLVPAIEFQQSVSSRMKIFTGLGFGYGYALEGGEVFRLNQDGVYEQKSRIAGRSQFLGSFQLGVSYTLSSEKQQATRLFLKFQTYVQGTYVVNYVPILPLNTFSAGIIIPLTNESN